MIPRKYLSRNFQLNMFVGGGNRGSVLIGVIIAMVIVAGMGGALVTMNSTSSVNQFGAMDSLRTFYLAESGGQYALPIIEKNIEDPAALIALLNNKTFSFANGDSFQLTLSFADPVYTLASTGILAQGTRELNATRQITYRITKFAGSVTNPFDTAEDLADNWTGYDDKKVDVVDNKVSDGSPALDVPGKEAILLLDWAGNPGLPDLAAAWVKNGGLLGYAIQIKIKIAKPSQDEYMMGLSFRVSGSSSYGFSFLKRDNCKRSLPSNAFCSQIPGKDSDLYLVLWENIEGNYNVLDYRTATSSDNVLDKGDLADWSTLVVKIEEEYILDGGGNRVDLDGDGFEDRKNRISCFVQGNSLYPRDTISWDYSLFQEVGWDSGAANPIEDTSLTTENFDVLLPNEIGLHNYFPDAGQSKTLLDDFAFQLGGAASGISDIDQY